MVSTKKLVVGFYVLVKPILDDLSMIVFTLIIKKYRIFHESV